MRLTVTYYLDVISSWCFFTEPAWAELKKRYEGKVEFQWKIALLDKTGPDAPTLCSGWTTGDLAAHLVLREHRPDAAAGVLGGPLAGGIGHHQRRVERHQAIAPDVGPHGGEHVGVVARGAEAHQIAVGVDHRDAGRLAAAPGQVDAGEVHRAHCAAKVQLPASPLGECVASRTLAVLDEP